jgi:YD repeat-containing protein
MGERSVDPDVPHRNAAEAGPGIHLVNGSVYHVQTDLQTAGRVVGLCMRRVYRGDMQFDGPIGQGWTGDLFQAAWRDESSGDLLWHDADGFLHTFVHRNDAWRSPPGVYVHASYENNAVSLRRADGTVLDFNSCGQLSAITDRHGNALTLSYDDNHQLQSVSDDRGWNWEFVHDANGRITQLIDHVWETDSRDPRTIDYEYDAAGRLIRVKLPETARYSDEQGNRVTREYEYDAAGRLLRVFAPNDVGDIASTEFGYEDGRVVSYRDGESSAWHYLRYTLTQNGRPLIRHLDPRGVRTDYTLDRHGRAKKVQQYTGFWDVNHDEPIDHDYVVQTGTKLRDSDPDRYATKYSFNRGHQLTRIDHPAGDREEFTYPNPTRLARGHATTVVGTVIMLDGAEWTPDEYAGGYVRLGGSLAEFAYYEVAGNTEDTLTVVAVDLNEQGWADGDKFVVFTENPDKLAAGNLLEHRWISTDPAQAEVTESFSYEPYYQQLRSATGKRGYTTTYEYGFDTTGDPADGDLAVKRSPVVTVRQSDGTTLDAVYETNYGYNSHGQLVSTTDPEGSVEVRSYYASGDQAGFLESIVRASGELDLTESYGYDKTGILTGQYPPAAFEPGANPDDYKTTWEINALGQRWHEAGPLAAGVKRVEVYRYFDRSGNETRTWRSYVTADGDAPANPTDVNDPDSFGKNSAAMAATWVETSRSFDIGNRLTAETSDAVAGAPVETVTWSYEYDELGNRTAKTSPLLNHTGWDYDERGLKLRRIEGEGSAVEGAYEFDYSLNGELAAERTPLGNETLHAFDGLGREISVQDPAGRKTEFEYDGAGNITVERCKDVDDVTLAEAGWSYDELDRVSGQSRLALDAAGAAIGDGSDDTILTLDGRGSVVARNDGPGRTWQLAYDAAGRLISRTDPLANLVSLTLDASGNPTRIDFTDQNPVSGVPELSHWEADYNTLGLAVTVRDRRYQGADFDTSVSFNYDGWKRLVRVSDAVGGEIEYAYDLRSRSVRRDEGAGGIQLSSDFQDWDRDDRKRLCSVAADAGATDLQTTSYEYDARNRINQVTRPDMTTSNFSYDADSNPTNLEDETGTSVEQAFDSRGLLTSRSVTLAGGTVGTTQESFQYDGAGRLALAESREGVELVARTELEWNTLAKAETRTVTLGDGSGGTLGAWTTASTYDVHGAATSESFSDGLVLNVQRDALSRLETVSDVGPGVDLFSLQWAGPGRVIEQRNGNTTTTSCAYEAGFAGLPSRIGHGRGGQTLWGFDYRYDLRGLATRERRDHEGGTGRVVSRDAAWRIDTAFVGADLAGTLLDDPALPGAYGLQRAYTLVMPDNRSLVTDSGTGGAVSSQAYTISGDKMNRYLSVGGFDLDYGAGARVTQDDAAGMAFVWDFRGRLSGISNTGEADPVRKIRYDALGWRVLENVLDNGVLQSRSVILYSPAENLPCEEITLDVNGAEVSRVQYARSGDDILAERSGGAWQWRHLDADGSLVGLTDTDGERTSLFDYLPFGTPMRIGVLADIAPGEISDVEGDTPAEGTTRVHVTESLSGDLLGHELAISVPGESSDRYRTASIVGFTANTMDVDDPEGLIENALANLGAGCLVLESRLALPDAAVDYDSESGTSTFTVTGAGFDSGLSGGVLVPNTSLPGWYTIIEVDPSGDWLKLRGNLTFATAAGDHWRAIPPVTGGERYLYRGMRHDGSTNLNAENRAGIYASRGRSYDPRVGRWMTPRTSFHNTYGFAPQGLPDQLTPPTGVPGLSETWSPSLPCRAQRRGPSGFRFAVPVTPGLSG